MELLQFVVGADDGREAGLEGLELVAGDGVVGVVVTGTGVHPLPVQPKLAAVRSELIASGRTAHVGRPIVAVPPAMPAACAASASSISCRALPRTRTTSGATGADSSGAYTAICIGVRRVGICGTSAIFRYDSPTIVCTSPIKPSCSAGVSGTLCVWAPTGHPL